MIPKSVNAERIKENFKSMNIFLDDNDLQQIKDIDKNFRLFKVKKHFVVINLMVKDTSYCCLEVVEVDV